MKIKLLFLLLTFLAFNKNLIGQQKLKGNLYFNAGIGASGLYKKQFNLGSKDIDKPESQNTIKSIDLNFGYLLKKQDWTCQPYLGFGYMPMGFIEKGKIISNDTAYTFVFKLQFVSVFAGYRVQLFKNKTVNISFSHSINPMFGLSNYSFIKKSALMTRLNFVADIELESGNSLSITPFYQTCLGKFNKSRIDNSGTDYFPYSFGINLGTYFKY
jgi:hypothetical protein